MQLTGLEALNALAQGETSDKATLQKQTCLSKIAQDGIHLPALNIGNVKWVGGSQTIQSVIDSCLNPAVDNPYMVMVPPGIYPESVVMRDFVSLQGSGRLATILEKDCSYVLTLANGVSVNDLSFNLGGSICLPSDRSVMAVVSNCDLNATCNNIVNVNTHNSLFTNHVYFYNCGGQCNFDGYSMHGSTNDTHYYLFNCSLSVLDNGATHAILNIDCDSGTGGNSIDAYNVCIFAKLVSSGLKSIIWTGATTGVSTNVINCYNIDVDIETGGGMMHRGGICKNGTLNFYGGSIKMAGASINQSFAQSNNGTINVHGTSYNGALNGSVNLNCGTTPASTGAGTVKMGSANPANSAGFIELYSGIFVPYWTTATPEAE